MKLFSKTFASIFISVLLIPVFGFAQGGPSLPHQFYGVVSYETGTTPDGLLVEARIGGIDGASIGNSETKDGKYGYNPDLLFAENPGSSATIHFFVNGVDSGETAIFVLGEATELNLTLSGNAPGEDDTLTPPVTPPAGSGGGGGGGSPAPASAEVVGDINGNSKVDKYDFALMMVDWGQEGSGLMADLNGDGKVDKYDFALLMLNWS